MAADIIIVDTEDALAARAADVVSETMRAAVAASGRFRVVLSGGGTPKRFHTVLAGDPRFHALPWSLTDVFWGDERTVPPDDPESNYRMARETLLSKVPVDPARVHRIEAEDPHPGDAARRYEETIREVFDLPRGGVPRFDLILLGLGADGHTASLFPESPALDERQRLVVATWAASMQTWRITMTLPVLNAAADVLFVVSGESKAAAVAAALAPPNGAAAPPAAFVTPTAGRLTWLLDRPAARFLGSVRE